jgi:hypothetical protein
MREAEQCLMELVFPDHARPPPMEARHLRLIYALATQQEPHSVGWAHLSRRVEWQQAEATVHQGINPERVSVDPPFVAAC